MKDSGGRESYEGRPWAKGTDGWRQRARTRLPEEVDDILGRWLGVSRKEQFSTAFQTCRQVLVTRSSGGAPRRIRDIQRRLVSRGVSPGTFNLYLCTALSRYSSVTAGLNFLKMAANYEISSSNFRTLRRLSWSLAECLNQVYYNPPKK